ncbi:MAG: 4-aminobutyrate aminotransferase [Candidatus Fischerbacteria bacterium RBG_13_37_8]|uniref:4-aminobutyrate aminotransferase n=1 Tax=Candidatus Fischerbacteria bacterium RBG_13_37_8 TaxID=1817863 RepID=A0A1F5VMA5_9BACT|nr:MAG: 4-aminobutyrate aminotransferase [Candidatus Fischerbacteria bacterium RBG_13_37_8]
MNKIKVNGIIPGPRAKEILKKDAMYSSPSYTRVYPLVIKEAKGLWVEDVDGNIFLDFAAGIAVNSTGHCHPRVVEAIKKQADCFLHMSGTDFYYDLMPQVAEEIIKSINSSQDWKVFFSNSGTEAVEAAMKLARFNTRKQYFIAFYGAFHGRTLGSMSLTASKKSQKVGFGAPFPGALHVPYADCYRCVYNRKLEECSYECIQFIKDYVFAKSPGSENIAAIVVEPIQGEGGYIIPPRDFLKKLRDLTLQENMLLIVDEIQSGFGRTGKMFAFQHFDVVPDVICVAKGIASGLPLGAMIAKTEYMNWKSGAHASTFGANPLSLAAAKETLDLVKNHYASNAAETGKYMLEKLKLLEFQSPWVGQVRGLGLMIGIDFVKDKNTKGPHSQLRNELVDDIFRKGLLVLGCGESTIRLCPPLCVNKEEADIAINILTETIMNIEKNVRPMATVTN